MNSKLVVSIVLAIGLISAWLPNTEASGGIADKGMATVVEQAPTSPIEAEMNIVGHGTQSVEIELRFRTFVSHPDVKANLRLPNVFRVLSGDQTWKGATTKNQWYSIRVTAVPVRGIWEVDAGVSMYENNMPVGAKSVVRFLNVSDSGVIVTKTDPSPAPPPPPQPKYKTPAEMFADPTTYQGSFTVTGYFKYNKSTFDIATSTWNPPYLRPIRNAEVKVFSATTPPVELLAGGTDGNGHFSLTVNSGASDIFVRVSAKGDAADVRTQPEGVPTQTYYFQTKSYSVVNDTLDVGTWTPTLASTNGGAGNAIGTPYEGVFNIYDAMVTARQYVTSTGGLGETTNLPPQATVWWKYHYVLGRKSYFMGPATIDVNGDPEDPDEWDDSLLIHEYGHLVMKTYAPTWPPYAVTAHYWDTAYSDYADRGLAYAEGWASFFSCAVNGSNVYLDTQRGTTFFTFDLELPTAHDRSIYCEGTAASILWHIKDILPISNIWTVLKYKFDGTNSPTTMADFWEGWNESNLGHLPDLRTIYNDHTTLYLATIDLDVKVTDPEGYARVKPTVTAFTDLAGAEAHPGHGVQAFSANLDYLAAGVTIVGNKVVAPFSIDLVSTNNASASRTSFTARQTSADPALPTGLIELKTRLTGNKDTSYTVTSAFALTLTDGSMALAQPGPTQSFRRGDANSSGSVTITDALFIAQYLVGLRELGTTGTLVNAVNAASPRWDDQAGDKINITDALYIAQMLAGLRGDSYSSAKLLPGPGGKTGTQLLDSSATVQIGSATLPPGANTQIPITVKSVTDTAGMGAYNIKVTFNPQVTRVDNVTAGVYAEPTFGIDNTNGTVKLTGYKADMPGPTGDVIVAYLSVTALGASGSSTPLDLSITTLSNSDGDAISATDVDGTVTINSALPTVAVLSPNGGQSWDVNGPAQTVTWTASSGNGITGIDILYSASSGADNYPYTIAQGIANSGSYTWNAPLGTASGNILSPYTRVKVVAHDGNGNTGSDISEANFGVVDTAAQAEIDLVPELDSSGYAVVTPNVKDLKNPSTQLIENIGDGLAAYSANVTHQVTQDSAGLNIKTVAGIAPFSAPAAVLNEDIGNNQLRTSVQDSQTSSMPMLPRSVAWLRTFLLGSKDTAYTLTLNFSSIARTSGSTVPQQASKSRIFKRGDAKADGNVTISDCLFISQYLAGSRTLGDDTGTGSYTHTHPINSAGVAHDDDTGDKITSADSLFISQMLSGLRDAYYNWIGDGLVAARQAASRTIAVAGKTTVESGSATLSTGASARIPITVKNIGDPLGLGSYNLKLAFDSKVIRVDSIESPAFAPIVVTGLDDVKPGILAVTCVNIDNKGGKIGMTAFQPAVPGPTKDVVIAYVTVTAIGPSRSVTPLTISSVNLTNADGKNIVTLSTNGSVSVN